MRESVLGRRSVTAALGRALALAGVVALAAWGCGDGSTPETFEGAAAVTGAEIEGRLAAPAAGASMLVFLFEQGAGAYTDRAPLSVATVAEDGTFSLPGLPAGAFTLVFLDDAAADGVIDPDDRVAVLADPDGRLARVSETDHLLLRNVRVDFAAGRATAEIEGPEPAAGTETPAPSPTA